MYTYGRCYAYGILLINQDFLLIGLFIFIYWLAHDAILIYCENLSLDLISDFSPLVVFLL